MEETKLFITHVHESFWYLGLITPMQVETSGVALEAERLNVCEVYFIQCFSTIINATIPRRPPWVSELCILFSVKVLQLYIQKKKKKINSAGF